MFSVLLILFILSSCSMFSVKVTQLCILVEILYKNREPGQGNNAVERKTLENI